MYACYNVICIKVVTCPTAALFTLCNDKKIPGYAHASRDFYSPSSSSAGGYVSRPSSNSRINGFRPEMSQSRRLAPFLKSEYACSILSGASLRRTHARSRKTTAAVKERVFVNFPKAKRVYVCSRRKVFCLVRFIFILKVFF